MIRQSICGSPPPLWTNDDGKMIARLLFAPMPSGQPKIIDLRQSMRSLMIGQGWSNNSWVMPIVEHPKNILDPNNFGSIVIYVGKGREWFRNSPWGKPMRQSQFLIHMVELCMLLSIVLTVLTLTTSLNLYLVVM